LGTGIRGSLAARFSIGVTRCTLQDAFMPARVGGNYLGFPVSERVLPSGGYRTVSGCRFYTVPSELTYGKPFARRALGVDFQPVMSVSSWLRSARGRPPIPPFGGT